MRLGDTKFFNLLVRLSAASNPDRDRDEWSIGQVRWMRRRHMHWSADHSFQIEVDTLTDPGRTGWTLVVVHEIWWPPNRAKAMRNARWCHLAHGPREKVLRWFKEQETNLAA